MEIKFVPRRTVWRGAGRPPREPSERALNALRSTSSKRVAVIDLSDDVTADDLRDMRLDLRAAARVLGGRVHMQKNGTKFLFYWEPESD